MVDGFGSCRINFQTQYSATGGIDGNGYRRSIVCHVATVELFYAVNVDPEDDFAVFEERVVNTDDCREICRSI